MVTVFNEFNASCIVHSPLKCVHAVFFSLQNRPLPSNVFESTTTQSLSDEEEFPVQPICQTEYPKCAASDCTNTAYYGFQSSEQPISCLKHIHPTHIDFRQKGVYTLQVLFTRKFVLVV
jgi:hypothetical protein